MLVDAYYTFDPDYPGVYCHYVMDITKYQRNISICLASEFLRITENSATWDVRKICMFMVYK